MYKRLIRFLPVQVLFIGCMHAAAHDQKTVCGNASVEGSFCSKITENVGAVCELLECLTGEKQSRDDIQARIAEMPAIIAEKAGMPVKSDEILIALQICDPERPLGAWHNGYSQQFGDGLRYLKPARLWPYSWVAHVKEGEQVKIPMFGGKYLAVLNLVSFGSTPPTFLQHAAWAVGRYLAQLYTDEETKQKIEALKRQSRFLAGICNMVKEKSGEEAGAALTETIKELNCSINTQEHESAARLLKEHYGVEIDLPESK